MTGTFETDPTREALAGAALVRKPSSLLTAAMATGRVGFRRTPRGLGHDQGRHSVRLRPGQRQRRGGQRQHAGPDVKLVALGGHVPREPRQASRSQLRNEGGEKGERFDVTDDRCFTGFDAGKRDHRLRPTLAPPGDAPLGFRPLHFKAAVDAGKHCFVEKPVATDGPGVRSVLDTCEQGQEEEPLRRLGTLLAQHHNFMRDAVQRIQDGARSAPSRSIQSTFCAAQECEDADPVRPEAVVGDGVADP